VSNLPRSVSCADVLREVSPSKINDVRKVDFLRIFFIFRVFKIIIISYY
jgi:hypothetical protein